ncbi:myb/SANT-like DNA-binding domain-containing protein 2 [Chrysemys picta bellii]|uniref:myb/SANT-like DNA-binding domain-containing protein 2 n=1 Tax=Chrysemys picta bellii TaxID=8478 RepID=UPI0032B27EAF
MQSSSAQVTMMESQDRKRAPAWTEREVRDLLGIWGDESVLAELHSSKRNGKILEKVSKAMKDSGHNRDALQCRVKIKELRQAYHKAREANGRSGAQPQTCRFYAELHAMLGGAATTTPTMCFDSINGESRNREAGSGYEEDDDEDNEDSSQQGSRETSFPNSQDMFITLDLEPVTPELTQGMLPDPEGTQGTSAANVSPSQRLVKIRRRKRRTRDDMFSEFQMSSHADRAQQNAWRQSMSECKKAQYEREERWRAESRAEESKWRAEEDR